MRWGNRALKPARAGPTTYWNQYGFRELPTWRRLSDVWVLAVNPDPSRWDGVLLPFQVDDLPTVLLEVEHRPIHEVTMALARLGDGQQLVAVNDFYIGARSHVSARYELSVAGRQERQSSSGIIVSTGLGSTGWLRSVLTGAQAVAGGTATPGVRDLQQHGFAWDAQRLVFSVREPFPSQWSQATLVFGEVTPKTAMRVRSLMPEGGVIFSDGVEADALDFRSGLEATIGFAPQRGRLLH